MKVFNGKGIGTSAATGRLFNVQREAYIPEKTSAENTETELDRYISAKNKAISQLSRLYEKSQETLGEESALIFDIQRMMIEDEDFSAAIEEKITVHNLNAEYAIYETSQEFHRSFAAMDNEYMQLKAADVLDISHRLIFALQGDTENEILGENLILCAVELYPAQLANLDKSTVSAAVMAKGSVNSHSAVLLRSMNIPAVVCVGDEITSMHMCDAVVDAEKGAVIIAPDNATIEHYKKISAQQRENDQKLQSLKGKKTVTRNGKTIKLCANISSAKEITKEVSSVTDGVGLFRSELLFIGRSSAPSEEEQFEEYKSALIKMGDRLTVIRTADIGADKPAPYINMTEEENPSLGIRGSRLSLKYPQLIKAQLRALYRASAYGKLGIMFPMISSCKEVSALLKFCEEAKTELSAQGIPYSDDVQLGIMIETPASALISDSLAEMVDFFSIGTNDLTMYTLAADRQNPEADPYCDPHSPAVMRLIEMTVKNAHSKGIWVGICGELAADTAVTADFIRMGIDELSMPPAHILRVKEKILDLDI